MLLTSKNFNKMTHYDVLSVKEDASYDEIRAGYKTAVLNLHPDKLVLKPESLLTNQEPQEAFLLVQNAWEVLKDSASRANYDEELRAARQKLDAQIDGKVMPEEMTVQAIGDGVLEFTYECRCGDYFSVTSVDLAQMGVSVSGNGEFKIQATADSVESLVLIPCGSCSLKIGLVTGNC